MDFHEMFENFTNGYGFDPDWVSDGEHKDRKQERHEEEDYDVPARKKSEGDWGP